MDAEVFRGPVVMLIFRFFKNESKGFLCYGDLGWIESDEEWLNVRPDLCNRFAVKYYMVYTKGNLTTQGAWITDMVPFVVWILGVEV